jgi:DNA-binding response OmpR family regulator
MRRHFKRTSVLIVEDAPELRELYRATLTAAGFAAVAVEDGLDALRLIETSAPAAVVLDIGLPRLSGHDFQRELRAHEHTRDVPIVIVTGADTPVNDKDFACVLRKPITRDELIFAVEDCLRRARKKS